MDQETQVLKLVNGFCVDGMGWVIGQISVNPDLRVNLDASVGFIKEQMRLNSDDDRTLSAMGSDSPDGSETEAESENESESLVEIDRDSETSDGKDAYDGSCDGNDEEKIDSKKVQVSVQ